MYELKPKIKVSQENKIITNIDEIIERIRNYKKIAIECYPGCDYNYLKENILNLLTGYEIIHIDDYVNLDVEEKMKDNITDDRVFGYMSNITIDKFYDEHQLKSIAKKNKYVVYGFGASQIKGDCLIYIDLPRWEIQKRQRDGLANWKVNNGQEDAIRKFKRGFFFEWRMADRIKKKVIEEIDYFLDITDYTTIKFIDGQSVRDGLGKVVSKPFRLVPFFDSGVWGGQWMKEKCNLDKSMKNYAWSFDGVPEENSIMLEFGDEYIELPAMTLVKYKPKELLGKKTYHRFGDEFPIRFDFLDTIEGQNLSLQVHPLTEYIQEKFGMNYTQDESYYILDTDEKVQSIVYLGFKKGINKERFIKDLKKAKKSNQFDVKKYVNMIDAKKHDHFLIPAGTIHCSGAGTMVLEISATPYIFTFKLWDWSRLGLDNLPRPTHIDYGAEVLNFNCDTDFVHKELVNNFEKISEYETKTGLHETQFIETRRFSTNKPLIHVTNKEFQMLNLVEGQSIVIHSPNNSFDDYTINYAETFIIPASVEEYEIIPNGEVKYIKAFVRFRA